MSNRVVVTCPSCATPNRVDLQNTLTRRAKCAKCSAYLDIENGVINASEVDLQRLIKEAEKPVIVDLWAPWCGPCLAFAPTYAKVASEQLSNLVFVKINTERYPGVAAKYQVRGIPTLIKIDRGTEIKRQSGAMPEPMFRQWL